MEFGVIAYSVFSSDSLENARSKCLVIVYGWELPSSRLASHLFTAYKFMIARLLTLNSLSSLPSCMLINSRGQQRYEMELDDCSVF